MDDEFGRIDTGRINMDVDSLEGDVPLVVLADSRYQQAEFTNEVAELWRILLCTRPPKAPVWNLNGVPYSAADAPPRKHDHWPQTVTYSAVEVWKCACRAHGGPFEAPWYWPPTYKPRYARPWWKFWANDR